MAAQSKLISMEEAAGIIKDGMHLSFSGFANSLCPVGFVRQLIRHGVKDLEISAMGELWAVDMLAGVGALKRVRQSCFLMEGFGRCNNFSRGAENGSLPVEDYSHLSITARFVAGSLGIPFLPIKSLLGSDIANISNFDGEEKYKIINDPFTGEKVVLMKKISPDVAVIHCSRADRRGNVQLFGLSSTTEHIAKCAKYVIATVEEIVDEDTIRSTKEITLIPGFFVNAVVYTPFGAHPAGMYKYYDFDRDHIAEYDNAAKSPVQFMKYIDKYVYSTKNEMEYLKKIGIKKLMDLRADPYYGISLKGRGVL